MKKESLDEYNESVEEEIEEQPSRERRTEKGNGVVFGFQIVLACLLIASAVLLKTNFTTEYEEIKRRYYVLLNEEISVGNLGKYISNLFKVDDSSEPPEPEAFASSDELVSISPSSETEKREDSVPESQPEPSSSDLPVADESDELESSGEEE